MKTAKLGSQSVSRLGLGCMGMSAYYDGAGSDDAESIRTIHRGLDLGITFLDSAEIYGPYTNVELVGRALRGRHDTVVLATKFGLISHRGDGSHTVQTLDSSPQSIRVAIEGSLRRLGTDHIDLYYQHRVESITPIEDVVAHLLNSSRRASSTTWGCGRPVQTGSAAHTPCTRSPQCRPSTRCGPATPRTGCCPRRASSVSASCRTRPLGRGFLTGTINSRDDFSGDDFRAIIRGSLPAISRPTCTSSSRSRRSPLSWARPRPRSR